MDRYYSPKDIMSILSISKTEALRIVHMFETRGKMYRFGEKVLRVRVKDFEEWTRQQRVEG